MILFNCGCYLFSDVLGQVDPLTGYIFGKEGLMGKGGSEGAGKREGGSGEEGKSGEKGGSEEELFKKEGEGRKFIF